MEGYGSDVKEFGFYLKGKGEFWRNFKRLIFLIVVQKIYGDGLDE